VSPYREYHPVILWDSLISGLRVIIVEDNTDNVLPPKSLTLIVLKATTDLVSKLISFACLFHKVTLTLYSVSSTI
jgi:hypothetical protein